MIVRRRCILALISASVAVSACASGMDDGPPVLSEGATPKYKLAVGDQLKISVFDHPEQSGEFRIDSGGDINFPLLGQVRAKGLTVAELRKKITTKLDERYIVDPKVVVEVLNYRPFFILGEIGTPGSYEYQPGLTVRQAVALAGGFGRRAATDEVILRRPTEEGMQRYRASLDTKILPGDTIEVQRRLF